MKYLYLILRLFKCPHKWQFIKYYDTYGASKYPITITRFYECVKCGKAKQIATK